MAGGVTTLWYTVTTLSRLPAKNREERIKNLDEAKVQYEKAIALDPINPLERVAYARLLNTLASLRRKPDPEVEKQVALARGLGSAVDGGIWDYDVYLATSLFKPYTEGGEETEDLGVDK